MAAAELAEIFRHFQRIGGGGGMRRRQQMADAVQALLAAAQFAQAAAAQRRRFQAQTVRSFRAEDAQQFLLPIEQLQRFAIVAEAGAQASDQPEQLRARHRLRRQFGVGAAHAGIEQGAHVQALRAAGIAGVLEQGDDEILHRLRARRFLEGAIGLPGDDAQRNRQHQADAERQHHAQRMPMQVFAHAITQALRARMHRLAVAVAAQVLRQCLDGGIALVRFLGQRFQHDVVEIAGDRAGAAAIAGQAAFLRQAHRRQRRFQRLFVQDGFFPGRIALAFDLVGFALGQQLVQHDAERIDVGHRRDQFAAQLLRRGVVQGEGARAGLGDLHAGVGDLVEQFRDAEIEQADLAGRRDQDVRGLQVAMHDEVGVRVADGVADLREQRQARRHVEVLRAGIGGDRIAADVVEREVGLAVLADAGIEQAGDVRMAEAREDLPFAGEARAQAGIAESGAQQFQRDAAFVQAVGAHGQPDLAHAAFAQRHDEPVRADLLTGLRREHGAVDDGLREEIRALVLQRHQLAQFGGERRIAALDLAQAFAARIAVEFQQFVQQRRQRGPAIADHRSRTSALQRGEQVEAGLLPVAAHATFGSLEQGRDLGFGQAGEVPKFDDLGQALVDIRQTIQRDVEAEHFLVQAQAAPDVLGQIGHAMQVAAAFDREALARVVHDDAAHRRSGVGEEMRAVLELGVGAADQAQIGFVHQAGGVQRLSVLPVQLAPGHAVQFAVERGQHAIERATVAFARRAQPLRDVGCFAHDSPVPSARVAHTIARLRDGHRKTARFGVGKPPAQVWQRPHQAVARPPSRSPRRRRPQTLQGSPSRP